ncbi:MAG: glycosyltransferase involved in cell wall biosynthesis [Candidatus Paceibacteria bacterium]|jgi:glycosyltransferase involved in cell wall biosynthesis
MNKEQKILYLITKSNWGGAQKYVFDLACAAKAGGHDVSVACGGTGEAGAATGPLANKLTLNSIPVHTIKNFMRNMSFFNDVKAFFEVWVLIRRQKPEVLHVTSSKAGGIGALAGRFAFVPRIIFTSHGLTVDEVWRPRLQRILVYIGTWLTLRLAHHNIMISTETFDRARKMLGLYARISLIKNGIAPIEFIERDRARAKLAPKVPPQDFWIGGIGELHPNKNWSSAILAMTTLPKHVHLIVIGAGEEYSKLKQLILKHDLTERVHLLGHVDGAQYLKAFDIFILPSKKEGLPYVLLEAGLAGLATVASDLPGNRDIIETGQSGLLVEPTPQLIVASLEILIRDESMRKHYGSVLNEKIRTSFSIQKMYEQTLIVYNSSKSRG